MRTNQCTVCHRFRRWEDLTVVRTTRTVGADVEVDDVAMCVFCTGGKR